MSPFGSIEFGKRVLSRCLEFHAPHHDKEEIRASFLDLLDEFGDLAKELLLWQAQ